MSTWVALVMYDVRGTYAPYHLVERHRLSTTICPGADAMDAIRLPLGAQGTKSREAKADWTGCLVNCSWIWGCLILTIGG